MSSQPNNLDVAVVDIPRTITEEVNAWLEAKYIREEVEWALKQMEPLKAPGPNGLPSLFFQKYWQDVGDDVSQAVLHYLDTVSFPSSLNHTFITLIPKVKSSIRVFEYRPISLCNILYKLVSKVVTNRLKQVLSNLISESQSAFQSNKAISDNILVAFETLHHMKIQKLRKMGFMALKLDMSKAYDRVEWSFLKKVMEKMGFSTKWITLIMGCISSVSYSILINGEPKGDIRSSRGIRKGDPLFPYLFLLCSKGLNRLFQKAAREDRIRSFSLCREGPRISHLFFVDDSLGKNYNLFQQSSFNGEKGEISNFLGIPKIREYEKNLGLPLMVGRNKRASLNYIKE